MKSLIEFNEAFGRVEQRRGVQPFAMRTSQAQYQRYHDLLKPQQRFAATDAPMPNLMFNGVPLIVIEGHDDSIEFFDKNDKLVGVWTP